MISSQYLISREEQRQVVRQDQQTNLERDSLTSSSEAGGTGLPVPVEDALPAEAEGSGSVAGTSAAVTEPSHQTSVQSQAAALQAAGRSLVPLILQASADPITFLRHPDDNDGAAGAAAVRQIALISPSNAVASDETLPPEELAQYHEARESLEAEARVVETRGAEGKATSLDLLRRRAHSGDKDAEALLGMVYFLGLAGEPKDIPRALTHYQKAADQGQVGAARAAGYIYQEGLGGVPKDLEQAEHYLTQAAEAQDALALWRLAILYVRDPHVEGSTRLTKALPLLEAAHERGVSEASVDLGRIFVVIGAVQKSRRVVQNARAYFEAAAQKDHPDALFHLGEMWQLGWGVPQDPSMADVFFERASQKGHLDAFFQRMVHQLDQAEKLRLLGLTQQGEIVWKGILTHMQAFPEQQKVRLAVSDAFVLYSTQKVSDLSLVREEVLQELSLTPVLRALSLNPYNAAALNNLGAFYENGYVEEKPNLLAAACLYEVAGALGYEKGLANFRNALQKEVEGQKVEHLLAAYKDSLRTLPSSSEKEGVSLDRAGSLTLDVLGSRRPEEYVEIFSDPYALQSRWPTTNCSGTSISLGRISRTDFFCQSSE